MRNSNQNTDAYADGFRFRLELFGSAANRLTPEFAKTKKEACRLRKTFVENGIQARMFAITEDGALRFS